MKYSMNGPLIQWLTRLADIMILNVVFIVSCLPVVTIGAAWTALYYMTLKMMRNEETMIIRGFFHSFRQNFRQATVSWLMILGVGILLFLDIRAINAMAASPTVNVLRVGVGLIAVAIFMVLQYLYPALSRFDASLPDSFKNACLMAVCHLPKTILMAAISAGALVFTLLNKYTMYSGIFAWLLFGFVVIALIKSAMLLKIFENYMPKKSGPGDHAPGNGSEEGIEDKK